MAGAADHFILICATCRGRSTAGKLRSALSADLPEGYAIQDVDCMAGCERPATVGFQAPGKASYLFGDIATADDFHALRQFAVQYRQSATGWTSATERPRALYEKTLARLPGLQKAARR